MHTHSYAYVLSQGSILNSNGIMVPNAEAHLLMSVNRIQVSSIIIATTTMVTNNLSCNQVQQVIITTSRLHLVERTKQHSIAHVRSSTIDPSGSIFAISEANMKFL